MKEKKKNVIIAVIVSVSAVLFIVFGTLAIMGIFRQFDAKKYVSAVLEQTLEGEVEQAAGMMEGATEEALYAQYEAGVLSFMKIITPSTAQVTEELEDKYFELCKKVLAASKYDVQEAKKISDDEYHVSVTYQSSNVLQLFKEAEANEIARMNEKKEKGEYRGSSIEDMEAQMQAEYLNNCYMFLEEAYKNMEFGEEQTEVIKVVKDEGGLYRLEESAITKFLIKILSLDAKED